MVESYLKKDLGWGSKKKAAKASKIERKISAMKVGGERVNNKKPSIDFVKKQFGKTTKLQRFGFSRCNCRSRTIFVNDLFDNLQVGRSDRGSSNGQR